MVTDRYYDLERRPLPYQKRHEYIVCLLEIKLRDDFRLMVRV
jgi:hypothetical protein